MELQRRLRRRLHGRLLLSSSPPLPAHPFKHQKATLSLPLERTHLRQKTSTTTYSDPFFTSTRRNRHRKNTSNRRYLYYSEIDPCIKACLNSIGTEQASPTESSNERAQMLMDYLHDHPDGVLRYHASDTILSLEDEVAYLVLPKAKSRAAGWFILGKDPAHHPVEMKNSPIHIMCNTIKNVMSSAAEAESGGIFIAVQ